MQVVKIRILRWMGGHAQGNMIRHEIIWRKLGTVTVVGKMRETRL